MKNLKLLAFFFGLIFCGWNIVFAWQPNIGFKRVLGPYGLTYSSMSPTYTKYTAITNNTPSLPGGSPTPTSWSISPALPTGLTFNTSNGIISGTPTSTAYVGSHVVTAANGGGSTTATLNITISPPNFTWTGAAFPDTSWSTGANWQGGTPPGSGATGIAIFDDECGAHCDATINSAVTIRGMRMKSTYTGTITQASGAGNILTIGTNDISNYDGLLMDGGTFVGGTANIRLDYIAINGGTFTSTAGELRFGFYTNASSAGQDGFKLGSSGTFNHNSGTVYLDSGVGSSGVRACSTFFIGTPVTFYNLTIDCEDTTASDSYNGGAVFVLGTSKVMNVNNAFTIQDGFMWMGTINFYGANAYFHCDSLATRRYCSRVAPAAGVYNYISDITVFNFVGTSAQTYTYDDGASAQLRFVINNASGVSTTTPSGRFGLMRLVIQNGTFQAPAGELAFLDDFPLGTIASSGIGLNITSPGVFDPNGGTVSIEGSTTASDVRTVFAVRTDAASVSFHNLTLNILVDSDTNSTGRELVSAGFESGVTVNVAGDLRVKNGRFREDATGGAAFTFDIKGNYYRECANYATHACADTDFKANKKFSNNGSQIYISSAVEADCATCTVTIAPGAGNTVTVNNNWNLRNSIAGNANLTVTSGTLSLATGSGILLGNNLTNNSAVTCSGSAVVQYFGSLSGSPGGGNNPACYSATPADAVASAVDWVNFSGTSASQAVSGVNLGVNVQVSRANVTGTPTCQYRQNGGEDGTWTTVPNGGSITTHVMNADGLEFKASGTSGHSCTYTIRNVSDSSNVIDTVTGTVP